MTHQAPPAPATPAGDPGRQIASLREALRLVRALHGEAGANDEVAFDEAARFSSAYERAAPIVQRRFDALAGETAACAAAGVEALLAAGERASAASAGRLAETIEDGLDSLRHLLRVT